ncbi:AraC family transcriptional regulator [Rhodobacteraceae bacterium F11138]|nr:AraC family transcriptional regulator [Rhodobacteraceae bacterium F11138]
MKPERRHGAVFVQALAEYLLNQGYDPADVFGDTRLSPDLLQSKRPEADFSDIAGFFEHAATLTGDDLLGFRQGERREMRRAGLLCYVGLASPTVLDLLNNIARYRRVFTDAIQMDVSNLAGEGVFGWWFDVSAKVDRRQHAEFSASGMMASIRQAAGRDIAPRRVTFRHLRNMNIDYIEQYFGCPVQFGASRNTICLAPSDLCLPLATSDNELYQVLVDYAEEVLQRKSQLRSDLLVDVERAIADRLASGRINQDSVAQALGMSPRTLARRLAQQGTTFFRTLEDLRKLLAIRYLSNSDLTLSEIAFLLGYSGLGSFGDAFKRWQGMTPGQYRMNRA